MEFKTLARLDLPRDLHELVRVALKLRFSNESYEFAELPNDLRVRNIWFVRSMLQSTILIADIASGFSPRVREQDTIFSTYGEGYVLHMMKPEWIDAKIRATEALIENKQTTLSALRCVADTLRERPYRVPRPPASPAPASLAPDDEETPQSSAPPPSP